MNGNKQAGAADNIHYPNAKFKEGLLNTKAENGQEKLTHLMQNTPDWFSHIQDENRKLGKVSECVVGSGSENIKTLFEQQQESFKIRNNVLFSQFVQKNQEHFAQLLEESTMSTMLDSFPRKPSSISFPSKQSKLCNHDQCPTFACTKNHDTNHITSENSTASACTRIQSSRSFQSVTAQLFSNAEYIDYSSDISESCKTHRTGPSHFTSDIPRFQHLPGSSVDFSSPKVNAHPPVTRAYHHRLLTRSTIEYVESSNSYKFSCKQVAHKFEHGYESVSESDDEEEESIEDIGSVDGELSEYDDTSVGDSDAQSGFGCMPMIEYAVKKDKVQQTLQKIATELLTTECSYVRILHLLDQVFAFRVDQENRAHTMFPQDIVTQMFTNLKSLYKLHHDFLLPQLEERMKNWETEKRIGDIMKNFAPFLKMYTEYVKNYDNAMNLINLWYMKSSRFGQIMDEIHRLQECRQLTLQHHMLTPVQRVPRYQLLLKDYLKKLSDDSPDKPDTEKALELVSIAANHANDTMKKIDKFKKLLEVQDMIGSLVDLVSPSRELLKEGKIIKISARSGDHQERYLFLFSDLLLLCSQRLIANKVVSGPFYRIRARLDVGDIIVEEGDNLETANTFYIRSTGRSIELYTPTLEEKMNWMEALAKAFYDLTLKKSSLKVSNKGTESPDSLELGRRAPIYIKLESITHCMVCDSQFSTFTFRRKHHCHACGIVACNKCLSHKMQLPYEGSKQGKVCDSCYGVLIKDTITEDLLDDRPKSIDSPQRQKGILDVMPSDPSVVSGYLQLKARSRFWVRRWFALHDDFVLYSFNSHLEEMALTSMPVPGYTIGMPDKGDNVDGRENVFKLFHKNKMYFFQTTNQSELERWVVALQKASRAENVS